MTISKVSVVIPTYDGMPHLQEAIQSVLDQSYPVFELIIVDDASPVETVHVVEAFGDPRIRYIKHPFNKGAVAARKTGVTSSSGDLIAFLDQDDLFHEHKLEAHVEYFRHNPEVGLTYNDRFEVQGSNELPCGLYRPPASLALSDWLLGFPVSPSDVVLRRDWALRDDIWDHSFVRVDQQVIFNGQEVVFGGRLALAGCRFGKVGRALNYRRHHARRILGHLAERCLAELACQDMILFDPRCPADVQTIRGEALSNICAIWAYTAYLQREFELGRQFLRQALELNPVSFTGSPCRFLTEWSLWASAENLASGRNCVDILEAVFENLPEELHPLAAQRHRTIARGHLLTGLRTSIWGHATEAKQHLRAAFDTGAELDDIALGVVTDELLNRECELGPGSPPKLDELVEMLSRLKRHDEARRLVSFCRLNRAFRNHRAGHRQHVSGDLLRAVASNPGYLLNRGVASMLGQALLGRLRMSFLAERS